MDPPFSPRKLAVCLDPCDSCNNQGSPLITPITHHVRAKELGYRPQKEVIYNKLLPYSDKLDAESAAVWRSVKGELGTAFAKREIRPAGLIWISRMCKYIRMYGYKFPKVRL